MNKKNKNVITFDRSIILENSIVNLAPNFIHIINTHYTRVVRN